MDDTKPDRKNNPYNEAGLLSRLLYCWVTPLVWRGYTNKSEGIPNYNPRKLDAAARNHLILEREWIAELSNNKSQPRLQSAIIRGFGKTLVFCSLSYFVRFTILGVMQTYFLDVLIGSFDADRNEWMGPRLTRRYVSAAILIASTFIAPMLIHHAFLNAQVQGVRLAVACSSLVYQKALRMSKAVLNSVDVGMLFNLLSNDVGKFDLAMNSAYTSIMEPVSIIVNIVFLWWMIGVAALPGFAVMAFVIIIYMIQARFFKKVSKKRTLATDERLKYTSTVISEMKAIKMFAWDSPYKKLIKDMRNNESKYLRYTCFLRASNFTITAIADKIALFFTILCGVVLGVGIDSHFIYPAWMTFSRVKDTFIGQITQAFEELVGCVIAVKRIEKLLLLEEMNVSSHRLDKISQSTNEMDEYTHIDMINLRTSWSSNGDVFQLKGISMNVPKSSICFIAGPVGSGKTSLLMSILNEMYVLEGSTSLHGRIGYASQEPWLFPATVRQNILFGLPYDEERYNDVLQACALTLDMASFEKGDQTSVGDKGSTLSGGQKSRINLARAMYRNADIILLDDILSAVDVNVGKHIMKNCIQSMAKDKLRIIVCHQLHYLNDDNYLVYINEGKVEVQGQYANIRNNVEEILAKAGDHFDLDTMVTNSDHEEISTIISPPSVEIVKSPTEKTDNKKPNEIMENGEISQLDRRKRSAHLVYLEIFFKLGTLFVVLLLLLIGQIMVTSSDIWLQKWSAASGIVLATDPNSYMYINPNSTSSPSNSTVVVTEHFHIDIFGTSVESSRLALLILSSLAFLQLCFIYLGYLVYFLSCLKAAEFLFDKMLDGVFSTKMQFFATNPKGRLINRFANDMESVDDLLPINLGNAIVRILNILGTISVIIYCNYIIAVPLIVVLTGEIFICKIYFKNMKPMKRLEASARSPVYTYLSNSLQGITTIRAHKNETVVAKEFNGHQDFHTATSVLGVFFIRWFGFWQDCLIACLTSFTTILLLFVPGVGIGSKIGLSISSIFTATYKLQFGLRQLCEADNKVISVERIEEYGNLPPEDGYYLQMPETVPLTWPDVGQIVYEEVSMRYSEESELVLKSVSFCIKGGEKVGIVGRTGAGKSSLISALFRMSSFSGRILVDNCDISTVNLPEYRRRLSVIPQDPVLLASSIRYNLDPFHQHSDMNIWKALEEVKLTEQIRNIPGGIESLVIEGGTNFSAGQRQLICLARAVLQKNKIILLDEATSNVDKYCDEVMQTVIRNHFMDSTILVIAHRLDTIIDLDKVMVLSEGQVMEFEDPYLLLQNENAAFSRMVSQTGEENARLLKDLAFASYKMRYSTW